MVVLQLPASHVLVLLSELTPVFVLELTPVLMMMPVLTPVCVLELSPVLVLVAELTLVFVLELTPVLVLVNSFLLFWCWCQNWHLSVLELTPVVLLVLFVGLQLPLQFGVAVRLTCVSHWNRKCTKPLNAAVSFIFRCVLTLRYLCPHYCVRVRLAPLAVKNTMVFVLSFYLPFFPASRLFWRRS